MKSRRLSRHASWLFLVFATSPALAQQQVARNAPDAADRSREENVLARPVTVDLDHVSLERAVKAIGASAAVTIQYRVGLVDAVATPVTLTAKQMPLGIALDRVLQGTGLQVMSSTAGVLTIRRREPGDAAQGRGVIIGKVVQAKTKAPVDGAMVTIDDAKSGTKTESDGSFRIGAATGERVVHVRGLGLVRQVQRVSVADGQEVSLAFAMEQSASMLDEVIVTGTVVATERKAVTTPITVITADELEKRNITRMEQLFRGDIPGVVALEQGTVAYSTMGALYTSRIYSRGSAGLSGQANPMKTYVDGVELTNASYINTIDPKSIERIEVITGPQAATIYGSGAMGGVMQIFTKRGNRSGRPEITANVRYGLLESNLSSSLTPSHDHALSAMGGDGPTFSYSGNLSYRYTGQWQPALFNRTTAVSAGATHTRGIATLSASGAFTLGQNGMAGNNVTNSVCTVLTGSCYGSLLIRRAIEDGDIAQAGSPAGYFSQQLSKVSTQLLSLNIDLRPIPIWQHHLTVGRSLTNFRSDPAAPIYARPADSLFNARWTDAGRMTTSYNTTFAPQVGRLTSTLTLGGSLTSGSNMTYSACLVGSAAPTYVGCDAGFPPVITRSLDDKSWGGFGSLQIGLLERLYLSLGLRGERNPTYGSSHPVDWTPTQGIAYSFEYHDLTVKLLGSYGTATRPPSPDYRKALYQTTTFTVPGTFLAQAEAPGLRPERSRGPQGGIELYYGNLGSLTINRYDQHVVDLIQSVNVDSVLLGFTGSSFTYYNPVVQYQNVAKIRQQGWEGTMSLNVGPLSAKGTYSWNDSRIEKVNAPNMYDGACLGTLCPGRSFQGIPTHTARVSLSYAHGGTSVTMNSNYVGSSVQWGPGGLDAVLDTQTRFPAYRKRSVWDNTGTIPGYTKSDLNASHRLTPWASATLSVTNLGNNFGSDFQSSLFPSLGRQTLMGLTLRWR